MPTYGKKKLNCSIVPTFNTSWVSLRLQILGVGKKSQQNLSSVGTMEATYCWKSQLESQTTWFILSLACLMEEIRCPKHLTQRIGYNNSWGWRQQRIKRACSSIRLNNHMLNGLYCRLSLFYCRVSSIRCKLTMLEVIRHIQESDAMFNWLEHITTIIKNNWKEWQE